MRTPAVETVPYLRLTQEYQLLRAEWLQRIDEAGSSGTFILGPEVNAFEAEAAAYLGVRHAISVANGTEALVLSLRALGIGPGDEVITSPFTFFATAEAVSQVGAMPVFADVEPGSFNLDPASVRQRITERTKALLAVHIFGHPADMDGLTRLARDHGLRLVEDAAQAFGAEYGDRKVGGFGDCGCFSFYPTKVLGAYGDGGMITTNDATLDEHLRRLRNHGATRPFVHAELGHNSRLDEVQAALLRIKLRSIGHALAERRRLAGLYDELFAGAELIAPQAPVNGLHAWNLYTIRHPRRDALREHLNRSGIGNSQCYPEGLHLQPVYQHLGYRRGDLPVAEELCTQTLSLPMFPGLRDEEVARVAERVREA